MTEMNKAVEIALRPYIAAMFTTAGLLYIVLGVWFDRPAYYAIATLHLVAAAVNLTARRMEKHSEKKET